MTNTPNGKVPSSKQFSGGVAKRAIPALLAASLAIVATGAVATASTESISLSITPTQTISNVYFMYGSVTDPSSPTENVPTPILVASGPIAANTTFTTTVFADTSPAPAGTAGPVQYYSIIATYAGTSGSGVSVGLDSGNTNYSAATSDKFSTYFTSASYAGVIYPTYAGQSLSEADSYSDLTSPNVTNLDYFYAGASLDASGNPAAGAAAVPIGTTGTLINFADETSNGVTGGRFLASVPEPAALGLLGVGGLLILFGRKGRRE